MGCEERGATEALALGAGSARGRGHRHLPRAVSTLERICDGESSGRM